MLEEIIARGWENLVGRFGGPMSFRFLVQPAVAIIFAVRAGLRDARAGRPPFLWKLLTKSDHRRELLRQGWKDVGTVFIVALYVVLRWISSNACVSPSLPRMWMLFRWSVLAAW